MLHFLIQWRFLALAHLMNIAIIQHSPVFLNLEASLEKALQLIDEAAAKGATLIVFPETWLPGYPVWLDYAPEAALWDHPGAKALYRLLWTNSLQIPGKEYELLRAKAVKHNVFIVMGIHERIGGSLYNGMLYLSPEESSCGVHRKLIPTYSERLIWGRGDGSTLHTVNTPFGILSGLICWEHWMPLARAAMHAKGETIHIAQWPMVKELHQIASAHYAFEGQCFVLAAGCMLSQEQVLQGFHSLAEDEPEALALLESMPQGALLTGGSAVYTPNSTPLVGPIQNTETTIHAQLNSNAIEEGRLFMDTSGHYSRPDVFRLEVNTNPKVGVVFKENE